MSDLSFDGSGRRVCCRLRRRSTWRTETIAKIADYSRFPGAGRKMIFAPRLAYERCLAVPASEESAEALEEIR
ncbi:hypothetical protein ML401_19320 [Bradyrhizobium sp. 62B]|uniref:hypothetical protein n=1 Tax=Bradyrhizobium sp. 62B TaxID=2898442 RepID=UPI0025582DC7|nr:hypothetical protein ML401_19320 [Bradyrhizobium sp. 62B]